MRRVRRFVLFLAAALLVAALTSAPSSGVPGSSGAKSTADVPVADAYTPVVASVIGPATVPVLGTDKKYHVAYDLELQNTAAVPVTVQKIDVVDAAKPTRVLTSYEGNALVERLRTLRSEGDTVEDGAIEPSGGRILYAELTFDSRDQAPKNVLHHLYALGPKSPAAAATTEPTAIDYTITPYDISSGKRIVLAPPVKGKGWVALNGCCEPGFPHRSSFGAFNGVIANSQLYAFDWKRMNDQGAFYTGDRTKNESYVDYGAKIYAVADGTVVKTLDTLDPNTPGVLPANDPVQAQNLTVETADGNHIILDLGHGVFVFYAHLQKGTLKVKKGDKVKKGEELALLGNTGNANASHLHIHVMDGPSVLGSHGLPYVISGFQYDGQVPQQLFADTDDYLTGDFGSDRLPKPQPRENQLPLNLAIVNFPG